jgi:hypothetical protein
MALHPLDSADPLPLGVERDFTAWAEQHQRENRRHAAALAQITRHPDPNPSGDARRQLQAWAVRQAHERHLQASAIAQIRHR